MGRRMSYTVVLMNRLRSWVGPGNAQMATRDILEALREGGYTIVPAEEVRRTA